MLRRCLAAVFVLAAVCVSAPAWSAGYAYVRTAVHLRAGPRLGYPVVIILNAGSRVFVHGCISDYAWCDVTADGWRGWVYASYLDYPYDGGYVPIIEYGPVLGIGIISFSIIHYWGLHYRHRPWYRHREHYRSRFGLHGRDGRPPQRWHRVVPPRAQRRPPGMVRPRSAPPRRVPERRPQIERQRQIQRERQQRSERMRQQERARIHQPTPNRPRRMAPPQQRPQQRSPQRSQQQRGQRQSRQQPGNRGRDQRQNRRRGVDGSQ